MGKTMIDPDDLCRIPGCGRRGDPKFPCMDRGQQRGTFCPLHGWQSPQQRLPKEFRRPAREVFGWSLNDSDAERKKKDEGQMTL